MPYKYLARTSWIPWLNHLKHNLVCIELFLYISLFHFIFNLWSLLYSIYWSIFVFKNKVKSDRHKMKVIDRIEELLLYEGVQTFMDYEKNLIILDHGT